MTTLNRLSAKTEGTVLRVRGTGSLPQRLMEMGFIEGAPFRVVRFAPLGDPIEVCLNGYNLFLRRSEARLVEVETCR